MRFRFLEISNYLSYGPEGQRIDFDDNLTVLLGPNGGGKTNILRSIDTVMTAIRYYALRQINTPLYSPSELEQMNQPHFKHTDEPTEIKLGIDLSQEKEEICSFIRGAIIHSFSTDSRSGSEDKANRITKLSEMTIPDWLTQGYIHLWHGEKKSTNWQLGYIAANADAEDECFKLLLPEMLIVSKEIPLQEERSVNKNISFREKIGKLPENNENDISFGNLLPLENEMIEVAVSRSELRNLKSNLQKDLSDQSRKLLDKLLDYDWDRLQYPDGQKISLHHILYKILQVKLHSDTEETSLGKPIKVTANSIASSNHAILRHDQIEIPRYLRQLYRWQNGDKAERDRFTNAQKIFTELTSGSKFDVRLAPGGSDSTAISSSSDKKSSNYGQSNHTKDESDYFTLVPFVERDNQEMPAYFAGSGVNEIMRLCTSLASESDSVVLLDEPTARLHPMLQKRFGQYLKAADAQYIVVSHAPGLFPIATEDKEYSKIIKRIALDDLSVSSKIHTLPTFVKEEACNDANANACLKSIPNRVKKEIRKNPLIHEIFFAEKLVLVSGESEYIAYQNWFYSFLAEQPSKQLGNNILHFHSFGGDNHLDVPLAIAIALAIPWIAFLDGKSYEPKGEIDGAKVPLALGQLYTAALFANDKDLQSSAEKVAPLVQKDETKNEAQWMESVTEYLTKFGFYTFANCWQTKGRTKSDGKTNGCTNCGDTDKQLPENLCRESFEDFCCNKFPELSKELQKKYGSDKIAIAREISEQPTPHCMAKIFKDFIDKKPQ